jgi:glycosyltransferase involved in cell wall biosynthesis
MGARPYFSVITPLYNRASTIARAIDSCLAQTDGDFELLVVDDGSTDNSASIVGSYGDSRVCLFRHALNRGQGPARNTAIEQAQGRWCVMLDSDDELETHALQNLRSRTLAAPSDVGNVASSCRCDDGSVTPTPPVPDEPLDYEGYVRWTALIERPDKLECIRREVFTDVRYPNSRAWELEFHLDVALRWRVSISKDILLRIHSDASNRLSASNDAAAVARVIQDAPDKLESFERVLGRHGPQIRATAPVLYDYLTVLTATQAICAGESRRALGHLRTALRRKPIAPAVWAVGALALLGQRAAAWATVQRRRWRA